MAGKWKDMMAMTRHERVGAVVVLVLLLAAVIAHVALSHRSVDPEQVPVQAIADWQRRCDSISAIKNDAQAPARHKSKKDSTATHKGKARKSTPKPKQPAPSRRLDPVPSF